MQAVEFVHEQTRFCRDDDFGYGFGCDETCQCRRSYRIYRLRYTFESSGDQPVTDRTIFTVTVEEREVMQDYFDHMPVPVIPDAEFQVILTKDVTDDEVLVYQPHMKFLTDLFGVTAKLDKLKTEIVRQIKISKSKKVDKSEFDVQIKEARDAFYKAAQGRLYSKDPKTKKTSLMIMTKLVAVMLASHIEPLFQSEQKECAHVSRKKK